MIRSMSAILPAARVALRPTARSTAILAATSTPARTTTLCTHLPAPTRLLHATLSLSSPIPAPRSHPCAGCGTPIPTVVPACPICSRVQPLDPATTYHEILGVDERARETGATGATIWRVDLPRARTRFLQLQRIVHPDVQGNDATDAEMQAAVINKAWACLKDELARAKYCLHLYDADVTESEPATDPDLLMFVMETREQVDDAQSLEELDELATAVQAEIGDAVGALDAAFAEVLSPFAPDFKPLAADDPGLAAVRDQVIKLQYFYNIMEAIADRRAELD